MFFDSRALDSFDQYLQDVERYPLIADPKDEREIARKARVGDREAAERPAGLRTHMLVSGAAALLVSLGSVLATNFDVELSHAVVNPDPTRLIEAVVTGVSFLGAGTIIRRQPASPVEGLTTAASILFTAAIGICVALSQFVLALGATVLALVILRLVRLVTK